MKAKGLKLPGCDLLTVNEPLGDCVKSIEEPGGNFSSLKTLRNSSMALASASV